jgi:hypothetical protein
MVICEERVDPRCLLGQYIPSFRTIDLIRGFQPYTEAYVYVAIERMLKVSPRDVTVNRG